MKGWYKAMKKLAVVFGVVLLMMVGCSDDGEQNGTSEDVRGLNLSYSRLVESLMGGPVELIIYDVECTEDYRDERCDVLHEAFDLIFDMEARWTVNSEGGEVQAINAMAGIEPVAVSADTFYLIEQGIHYALYSDSDFNIAIGPLTGLWNIAMPGARRPGDEEIAAVLPLLDPRNVILDPVAQTVFLTEPGMALDLGGIAKGYMPDVVKALFLENGITRGRLMVGGEVVALDGRADGSPFRIGIRNPFFDGDYMTGDEYLVGNVPLFNQAMVTSGTYNRFLAHQDTQTFYHHIFDSHTGFPFESDIVSISIISDTGLLGEVYTKIVFAMGIERGLAYVEGRDDLEVLMIREDGGIYISSGLQDDFNFTNTNGFYMRTPLN